MPEPVSRVNRTRDPNAEAIQRQRVLERVQEEARARTARERTERTIQLRRVQERARAEVATDRAEQEVERIRREIRRNPNRAIAAASRNFTQDSGNVL